MDADSFIVYIKTEDIFAHIAKNVRKRLDTSNYGSGKPIPKRKIKK